MAAQGLPGWRSIKTLIANHSSRRAQGPIQQLIQSRPQLCRFRHLAGPSGGRGERQPGRIPSRCISTDDSLIECIKAVIALGESRCRAANHQCLAARILGPSNHGHVSLAEGNHAKMPLSRHVVFSGWPTELRLLHHRNQKDSLALRFPRRSLRLKLRGCAGAGLCRLQLAVCFVNSIYCRQPVDELWC